jgi:hypothetical protein
LQANETNLGNTAVIPRRLSVLFAPANRRPRARFRSAATGTGPAGTNDREALSKLLVLGDLFPND